MLIMMTLRGGIDFGDGEAIGTDCESIHLKNGKNWEMRTSHSWRKRRALYGVHTVVKDCVSGSDKDAFDIDIGKFIAIINHVQRGRLNIFFYVLK